MLSGRIQPADKMSTEGADRGCVAGRLKEPASSWVLAGCEPKNEGRNSFVSPNERKYHSLSARLQTHSLDPPHLREPTCLCVGLT